MFVLLSKVLAIPLDPMSLALALLAAGFVCFYLLKKKKPAMILFICGSSVLLFFSLPITTHVLLRGLEGRYPQFPIYEQTSAVVLLGGTTVEKVPPRIYVEVNSNSNRIFHAARVFKETYSSRLVLTGGLIGFTSNDTIPEAYAMFELMNELFNIDTADMILEYESRNTRENAKYTKMALEQAGFDTDIILVTNAYHMPRSVGIFKKAGFKRVIPAPTGYLENEKFSRRPLNWLPNPACLLKSSIALHEYFGIVVYRIMGWI
jgi:uncharacterized SAM-binding protein YcdF (DUF218 family)